MKIVGYLVLFHALSIPVHTIVSHVALAAQ